MIRLNHPPTSSYEHDTTSGVTRVCLCYPGWRRERSGRAGVGPRARRERHPDPRHAPHPYLEENVDAASVRLSDTDLAERNALAPPAGERYATT